MTKRNLIKRLKSIFELQHQIEDIEIMMTSAYADYTTMNKLSVDYAKQRVYLKHLIFSLEADINGSV